MRVGVTGMGAAFPTSVRTNEQLEGLDLERVNRSVITETAGMANGDNADPEVIRHAAAVASDPFRGSRERHVLSGDETLLDLEVQACRSALADAGVSADEIGLLLVYSAVPDTIVPTHAGPLAHRLGCSEEVMAWAMDAGCVSFMTQLWTAGRMITGGDVGLALIVQSSAISTVTEETSPLAPVGGDGAVASVVGPVDDPGRLISLVQRTRGDWACSVMLGPRGDTPWHRTDLHGERIVVHSKDRDTARMLGLRTASVARPVCLEALQRAGWEPTDVDFFVLPQVSWWFASAVCEAVGVPRERILTPDHQFERYGHLLPASVSLNLKLGRDEGRCGEGSRCLVYAPSAGFVRVATTFVMGRAARRGQPPAR